MAADKKAEPPGAFPSRWNDISWDWDLELKKRSHRFSRFKGGPRKKILRDEPTFAGPRKKWRCAFSRNRFWPNFKSKQFRNFFLTFTGNHLELRQKLKDIKTGTDHFPAVTFSETSNFVKPIKKTELSLKHLLPFLRTKLLALNYKSIVLWTRSNRCNLELVTCFNLVFELLACVFYWGNGNLIDFGCSR